MPATNHRAAFRRVRTAVIFLLLCLLAASPAAAANRIITRDLLGATGLKGTCLLLGCNVVGGLGDPAGQLFLITVPTFVNPAAFIVTLLGQPGILDAEMDQVSQTVGASAGLAPDALTDTTPVSYYGVTVWRGYAQQPAVQLISLAAAQSSFGVAGKDVTVAVIDTGVDPTNPVLQGVLTSGYDFTRNASGGSEMADVSQSTVAVLDGAQPAQVNQSTVAVLDQSTVAVLDTNNYAAFGHGTMVAGIVHLVAPRARIMPLKSFRADGSGYLSDILRAVYYGVRNGARVLNMSFSVASASPELANAIGYAARNNAISVASAGNDGQNVTVYPAAYTNVIDVASTNNHDIPSCFSNYGAPPVWLTAPGEGIVTTYPWGTYAAGWGTSFSAPFVSGTAALLLNVNSAVNQSQAASALAHADSISAPQYGYGRLDIYQGVQAAR